jgi:hypothetical protein
MNQPQQLLGPMSQRILKGEPLIDDEDFVKKANDDKWVEYFVHPIAQEMKRRGIGEMRIKMTDRGTAVFELLPENRKCETCGSRTDLSDGKCWWCGATGPDFEIPAERRVECCGAFWDSEKLSKCPRCLLPLKSQREADAKADGKTDGQEENS